MSESDGSAVRAELTEKQAAEIEEWWRRFVAADDRVRLRFAHMIMDSLFARYLAETPDALPSKTSALDLAAWSSQKAGLG